MWTTAPGRAGLPAEPASLVILAHGGSVDGIYERRLSACETASDASRQSSTPVDRVPTRRRSRQAIRDAPYAAAMTVALPFRSPWIEQLRSPLPSPLVGDADVDVAVVGAGIAGVATAFHVLRATPFSVLLIEGHQVGRGASGRNAGQLVTYTERPLHHIAAEYGEEMAIAAQRELDDGWSLLREMLAAAAADVHVEELTGHMGMRNLNHVVVHLRDNQLRRRGGLEPHRCVVSEQAPFLPDIPADLAGGYEIVSQATVRELLDITDDRYLAVLSHRKGIANSALVCERVLDHLIRVSGDRLHYVDRSPVDAVVLRRGDATLRIGSHEVRARSVVLCTNGYTNHLIENHAGAPIPPALSSVAPLVGYMVAAITDAPARCRATSYVRNVSIGDDLIPYVYVTERPYERGADVVGLTCIGGPEAALDEPAGYDPDADLPLAVVTAFNGEPRSLAFPAGSDDVPFAFAWHGVMAYTDSMIRRVGVEPRNPVLLYNLGCNGVGFLPSITGGQRIARLLAGEQLAPSIFDPR